MPLIFDRDRFWVIRRTGKLTLLVLAETNRGLAVHAQPPGRASQVSSLVLNSFPGLLSIQLQKHVLGYVFSIGGISEHRVCNSENEAQMHLNKARELCSVINRAFTRWQTIPHSPGAVFGRSWHISPIFNT